ncbi:MAG: hypothetical protein QXI58_00735 [Candidatus Micrarchaeia archaeon]
MKDSVLKQFIDQIVVSLENEANYPIFLIYVNEDEEDQNKY